MKKITFLMALLCASVMSFAQETLVTACDFTQKTASHTNYTDSWKYGDWTLFGAANNNGGWAFVKFGGKDTNLATANPCYVFGQVAQQVSKIKVTTNSGNLTAGSVNEWGVNVYEDETKSKLIENVVGGSMTKKVSEEFNLIATTTWAANSYYEVYFNLANTTGTNGIVWIDKIEFYFVEDIHATAIQLSESEISMKQYKSFTLVANLTPSESTDIIEWSSNNEDVATVIGGVVYATGEGEAVITAKVSETVSATCTVTVTAPEVLTCKDAAEKALSVSANDVLYENGMYVVYGYVTALVSGGYNDTYGNSSFWMADEANGGNVFEIYAVTPLQEVDKAVKVGDYIMAVGNLTKYGTTPEMSGKNDAKAFYTITVEPAPSTGLENVNAVLDMNAPMYNVMGQQVSADYKGIVLQNGQKYLLY